MKATIRKAGTGALLGLAMLSADACSSRTDTSGTPRVDTAGTESTTDARRACLSYSDAWCARVPKCDLASMSDTFTDASNCRSFATDLFGCAKIKSEAQVNSSNLDSCVNVDLQLAAPCEVFSNSIHTKACDALTRVFATEQT